MMPKRVLFTATLVRGHIAKFHIPYLKWFKEQGWETWVAAKNDYPDGNCEIPFCDRFVNIDFARSPFSKSTISAFGQLKKLLAEERFDIIHTHTPVGSVLTRLAASTSRKNGTKVIYTAHGFHFYDGAPMLNWLLWFPVEKAMSSLTDCLITINKEDFDRANRSFDCDVVYAPGVGVDDQRYAKPQSTSLRKCLGISDEIQVLLSVGDLNKNKNHRVLIEALPKVEHPSMLLIAGEGSERDALESLSKSLGVSDKVLLLGFRNDIPELLSICDIFCFPSKREGLPISLIEAMAAKKPCVTSSCRGTSELMAGWEDFVVCDNDSTKYARAINELIENEALKSDFAESLSDTSRRFCLSNVVDEYAKIYRRVMAC